MNKLKNTENVYISDEIMEIITEYMVLIDIINFSRINREIYDKYNGKIAKIMRDGIEKRVKELGGEFDVLFDYIRTNGDIITGSIILQVLYGKIYKDSDIDVRCYRKDVYPYTYDNFDRYWPNILGECYVMKGRHEYRREATTEELIKYFGLKVLNVYKTVANKNKDEKSENEDKNYDDSIKIYDIMMLEDNEMENEKCDKHNNTERVINKLIEDVKDGYDIDVCGNAFWINSDRKACFFIKNIEGITNKTTKINNVIPQSFYVSYMYSIDSLNTDIDIAGCIYERLLKYISRGFTIINDTDNYITKSVDISRLLKNYPLDTFYKQTSTCLNLYKCLPSVIYSESDINILIKISNRTASYPDINIFNTIFNQINTSLYPSAVAKINKQPKKQNHSKRQKSLEKLYEMPDVHDFNQFPTLQYSHKLYLLKNK